MSELGKEDNSKFGTLAGNPKDFRLKVETDFNADQFEKIAHEPLSAIPEDQNSNNSSDSSSSDNEQEQ